MGAKLNKIIYLALALGFCLTIPLFAKDEKKEKSGKKKGVREKFIVREAQVEKEQKSLDFEATDIAGERKIPLGSLINQNKSDKEFDLIKIRLRWHPEMIQSTASIETGRSK